MNDRQFIRLCQSTELHPSPHSICQKNESRKKSRKKSRKDFNPKIREPSRRHEPSRRREPSRREPSRREPSRRELSHTASRAAPLPASRVP